MIWLQDFYKKVLKTKPFKFLNFFELWRGKSHDTQSQRYSCSNTLNISKTICNQWNDITKLAFLWFRNIWFYIQSKNYKTCTKREWIKDIYTLKNKYSNLNIWIQQKTNYLLNTRYSLKLTWPIFQTPKSVNNILA